MSEHLDTKSVVEVTSCSESHDTAIVVKWGPFGRSKNRRTMGRIPPFIPCNSKDPVSLSEVEGVVHCPSVSPWSKQSNARSSRRGREQTRVKSSEFGRAVKVKRSDLRTGDNPCNETTVSLSLSHWPRREGGRHFAFWRSVIGRYRRWPVTTALGYVW